jgi:ribulose kinase
MNSNKPMTTTAPMSQPIGPFTDIAAEPVADGALTGATVAAGALDAFNAGAASDAGVASLALATALALVAG